MRPVFQEMLKGVLHLEAKGKNYLPSWNMKKCNTHFWRTYTRQNNQTCQCRNHPTTKMKMREKGTKRPEKH
jgi:hypothetical protein